MQTENVENTTTAPVPETGAVGTPVLPPKPKKKKTNKCHHYCSVPGCKTSMFKDEKMSFHTFPREGESEVIVDDSGFDEVMDRRDAWIRRTFIGKSFGREITSATYVCSRHFELSDFCSQEKTKKRCRRLKRTAIPTLNLPQGAPARENHDKQPPQQRPPTAKVAKPNPPSAVPEPAAATATTLSIPITLDELQQSDLTAGKYFSKVRLIVVDSSEPTQLQISLAEAPDPDPSLADAADKTIDLEEPILTVSNGSKTLLEMFEQGDQPNWDFDPSAGPSTLTLIEDPSACLDPPTTPDLKPTLTATTTTITSPTDLKLDPPDPPNKDIPS